LGDQFNFQVGSSDPEAIAIDLEEHVGQDRHGLSALNDPYGRL
jgi:hypothetical protein